MNLTQRCATVGEPYARRDFTLGIPGFDYRDLYDPDRLRALYEAFDQALEADDPEVYRAYDACRKDTEGKLPATELADALLRTAPYLGRFVARLFNVEAEREAQRSAAAREFESVFTYKNTVVKRVGQRFDAEALASFDLESLTSAPEDLIRAVLGTDTELDPEQALATVAVRLDALAKYYQAKAKGDAGSYGGDAEADTAALRQSLQADPAARERFAAALAETDGSAFVLGLLDVVERWTYAALNHPTIRAKVTDWASLKQPERIAYERLVECHAEPRQGFEVLAGPLDKRRRRDGFALTDLRATERESNYEVDRCVLCHVRNNDYCSKGQRTKEGGFRHNPLDVTQIGCPLEERISEAFALKREGDNIAALAMIVADNPMAPGTGHRICNECMKACVFQRVTEPVNIPQVETNILTDVLFMPYGFEIYSLLTRWNPLNLKRPYALPYNGKKVLVVGLGPAGYTLAHFLLNEGFGVVAIDALKIEPLPEELTGKDAGLPEAVDDFHMLYEDLDKRVLMGFGGVAEYGITVRWDKNFLKVIYLTLARRRNFSMYGGVRLGSTLSIDDAWTLGFDHIAIASGAGKPTMIGLENNLARGIRKASDFLMALQLSGAAKQSSLSNLQVRLPAGVIGGGLTATDAVTELLAYYPVQVEKTLDRYERLVARYGETQVRSRFDGEELSILDEFLTHGRAIRAERWRAEAQGETPDFEPLIRQWGGVTLFYRKGMNDSPAYRQNHEEIIKAMEEGLVFAEGMNPKEAITDDYGYLQAVRFEKLVKRDDGRWVDAGEQPIVPLRTLLVAAGTSPNTIYENEFPGTFKLDGNFFQRFEPAWNEGGSPQMEPKNGWGMPKELVPAPFTSYGNDGKYITYYGDNHPVYAGNVVKAMASAKDGYPYVVKLFEKDLERLDEAAQPERDAELATFQSQLDEQLTAEVVEVKRLTPTIVEITIKAPMAARKFQPGQFYRVQNFESYAPRLDGTSLATEGIALTGAWVDREKGLVGVIALEMGTSSRLCATWKPGDPVVLMGPTGAPTEIPRGETVLLLGGGLGNAVLFSIGKALRENGNRVLYFAGYRSARDLFKVKEIEDASDVIVWSVDKTKGASPIATTRPQDKSFVGNIVEAMVAYGSGELGDIPIPLKDADRIIAIGSDRMMSAVKAARFGALQPYLKENHVAIGSINSPMQCMMKGVCAQCMCKQKDPETGKERFVYTCFNQDQDLDQVDFPHLNARLRQNTTLEKVSNLWLDYLFESYPMSGD
ncbi:oxidoreductase FAD/NAD(P)-binding domain-containing protein [Methylocaldum marinum]|uniref:Oxidoreductase FAD/NAD(P)-binding domain-containing protein n=1 Tax=Methylocaldum marinum TaxID=1432792 RepID=A0A250L0X6_9GAMM|nr:FAD-dependent oxidoreductase [Methylocaldum marinum]BBA37436.1 oxidoreductase FAD/NAD(P)-binding domain-containing protein [Methylocaldum marinum]